MFGHLVVAEVHALLTEWGPSQRKNTRVTVDQRLLLR
jgi:hypothetical protein